MCVTIRPFQPDEIQQLEKLHKALYGDPDVEEDVIVDEENIQEWRKQLFNYQKEDKNQILVAETNGEVVGYICFYNPVNERFGLKTKHFFGGLAFGLAFFLTGSLTVVIIAHFVGDMIGLTIQAIVMNKKRKY